MGGDGAGALVGAGPGYVPLAAPVRHPNMTYGSSDNGLPLFGLKVIGLPVSPLKAVLRLSCEQLTTT